MFGDIERLPPNWETDHAILLKEHKTSKCHTVSITACPKNEIERLVREMLAAGIIQPSKVRSLARC